MKKSSKILRVVGIVGYVASIVLYILNELITDNGFPDVNIFVSLLVASALMRASYISKENEKISTFVLVVLIIGVIPMIALILWPMYTRYFK